MLWAWMSLEMLSGANPCASAARGDAVREAADPVPHVEKHATFAGANHLGEQPAVAVEDSTLVAVEAMRDDVAGDEVLEQPGDGPFHVDDVDHEGKAEHVGRLAGEVDGRFGVVSYHLVAEADLYADDDVRVFPRRAIAWSGEAQRTSSSSPSRFVIMPWTATCRKARIRVSDGSMMNRRKPGNVCAPDEPASTAVVTPRPRQ